MPSKTKELGGCYPWCGAGNVPPAFFAMVRAQAEKRLPIGVVYELRRPVDRDRVLAWYWSDALPQAPLFLDADGIIHEQGFIVLGRLKNA